MRKQHKRKWFSPFMLLRLLGIALFVYILSSVDLDALWQHLGKVSRDFLLLGILFQVVLLFLKAIRWHVLNNGSTQRLDIFRSFGEFFESYAYGVITPGRLGELVKAGHAREKNKVMETGIRVAVERGFDLGIFVMIAGAALYFIFEEKAAGIIALLTFLAGFGVFLLAIVLMRSASATRVIEKIANRIPFLKLQLSLNFRRRKGHIRFWVILLSLASNLSYFISCYFLAQGLSFEQSFMYISGAVAMAGLLNMLPVTVMGLGTREGVFLLLFKPLAEPLILAFSGLVFLIAQVGGGLLSLVLGLFFLQYTRRQKSAK